MKKSLILTICLMFCSVLFAQSSVTDAQKDSINQAASDPDFITVSLMKATPGKDPYALMGHAFLRLQSPSNDLDICYTFSMDTNPGELMRFLQGKAMAGYVLAPTEVIIDEYRKEGRGVSEIKLNLTPKEKQELWKYLDRQLKTKTMYHYDYLHTNCSSMTINAVEQVLDKEVIVYNHLPECLNGVYGNYRKGLVSLFDNCPWQRFFWNLTLGHHGDTSTDLNGRLFPEFLWDAWMKASLKSEDGETRSMTVGEPHELTATTYIDKPLPVTPIMVFGLILVLTVVSVFTDIKRKLTWLGSCIDKTLVAIHLAITLWICYLLLFSDMIATDWNWMVLVFNPLPEILWLFARKKKLMRLVYAACALMPLAFIALTPLIPQMQPCPSMHCLFTAFILRAAINYKTYTNANQ